MTTITPTMTTVATTIAARVSHQTPSATDALRESGRTAWAYSMTKFFESESGAKPSTAGRVVVGGDEGVVAGGEARRRRC